MRIYISMTEPKKSHLVKSLVYEFGAYIQICKNEIELLDFLRLHNKDEDSIPLIILELTEKSRVAGVIVREIRSIPASGDSSILLLYSDPDTQFTDDMFSNNNVDIYQLPVIPATFTCRARILQNTFLLQKDLQETRNRLTEALRSKPGSGSNIDPITGLQSIESLLNALRTEWLRCLRHSWPIACLKIRISSKVALNSLSVDHKRALLGNLAACIQDNLFRPGDFLGIEHARQETEFTCIMSETDFHGAETVAKRILEACHKILLPESLEISNDPIIVIGGVTLTPRALYAGLRVWPSSSSGESQELQLLTAAERALQRAIESDSYLHLAPNHR